MNLSLLSSGMPDGFASSRDLENRLSHITCVPFLQGFLANGGISGLVGGMAEKIPLSPIYLAVCDHPILEIGGYPPKMTGG